MGLELGEKIWDATVFCHNRDKLLTHEVAEMFFEQIKAQASASELLSKEHFSTDSILLDAAASIKSFKRKETKDDAPSSGTKSDEQKPAKLGRNVEVDFHGKQHNNETHQSSTDGDDRLYRKAKGKEAKLSFMGTC